MERFTHGEKTVLAGVVVLAVAAGVFVWTNFTRAFPEASLEFKVNRSSSLPVGKEFLRRHAPQAPGTSTNRAAPRCSCSRRRR